MEITVKEAAAILGCEGGVQVFVRGTLETLDGVISRQPAHDPLVESHACGYRRATAAGLKAARLAIRNRRKANAA
jgi:hypothetical protein